MINLIQFSFNLVYPEWTASQQASLHQAVVNSSSVAALNRIIYRCPAFESRGHGIIHRYRHDHCPLSFSLSSLFLFFYTHSSFGGWWVVAVCVCVCVCWEIKGRHVFRYEPWDLLWPTNTLRDISKWRTAGGEQLSLWADCGICYDKQTKSQLSLEELGVF